LKAKILGLGKMTQVAEKWFGNKRNKLNAPEYSNVLKVAKGIFYYFSNKIDDASVYFDDLDTFFEFSATKDFVEWKNKIEKIEQVVFEIDEAWDEDDKKKTFKRISKAIQLDPENIHFIQEMLIKRACVSRLKDNDKKLHQALEDINKALSIDANDSTALFIRGKLFFDLKKYEDAINDFKKSGISKGKDYLIKVCEQKMKPQMTHYDALGLKSDATLADIKSSYRTKAKLYHPDKNSGASEDVRQGMETKMKEISNAYSCLSNTRSRAEYDNQLERACLHYDDDDNEEDYANYVSSYYDDDDDVDDYDDDDEPDCCGNCCNCGDTEDDAAAFLFNMMMRNMFFNFK